LKAGRERLQPEDVGLPSHGYRRVRGLRREEVAELAHVSVTWYTWIEQGRDVYVSAQVIDSLCAALLFDDDARHFVRRLAGKPIEEPHDVPTDADPELRGLVEDLLPSPACVVTGCYDVLAWNRAYVVLFGDPLQLEPEHRNLIWMSLGNKQLRQRSLGWPAAARVGIAYLRAESAKHSVDPRFAALIENLQQTNADFRATWNLGEVRNFLSQTIVFDHPGVGELRLKVLQFDVRDDSSLSLIVHYPTDEITRARLSAQVGAT
jgi:transcriptional regulator with XRE-family HTH domain